MTLTQLRQRFALWRRQRDDMQRLHDLDDHLLGDLGIERRQIRDFVRGRLACDA